MVYVARRRKTTKKRTYRRRTTNANTVARIARKVMLNQAETKRHLHASGVIGLTDVIMPDNTSRWLIENCVNLSQGVGRGQAIGEQIFVKGLSIKLQCKYTDNFAPYFKIFVVEANQVLLGGLNTIFEHSLSNAMLDNIKKQYRVLKCIVVNPMMRGAAGANQQPVPIFRKLWIPINRKYDFRTSNLDNNVSRNIGIVAIAYVAGNPVNLDVGTVSCYSTVYFKDF